MRHSKYWDDFEKRSVETINCINNNLPVPVRRVSCFITNKCNFRCKYCNMAFGNKEMSKEKFLDVLNKYGNSAIIHVTGGEPSVVKYLYPEIEKHKNVRFHLNTNAFIMPPNNIQRLKVSMDTHIENDFDNLVSNKGAFKQVIKNIKKKSEETVTTITCVLSKQTYKQSADFMRFCRLTFPKLYAVFFSCYKGNNTNFVFSNEEANEFFNNYRYKLESEMDSESLGLFKETIEEKFRMFGNKRFPENIYGHKCYLSLSERVYDYNDCEFNCSHLYRDKTQNNNGYIQTECSTGCNLRLVKFNELVSKNIKGCDK